MATGMPNKNPNEEVTFKCPSCGEMLSVEPKENSDEGSDYMSGNKQKSTSQPNAATMPMGQLKHKISQVPGMPQNPMVPPNLSSY